MNYNYYINKKSVRINMDWLLVLLGITSTMPLVGIYVFGIELSVYRILFFLCFFQLVTSVIKNPKLTIGTHSKRFVAWLIAACISAIIGGIVFFVIAPRWSSAAFSQISKTIIFILFALLWSSNSQLNNKAHCIIKGFLLGCILNCIWASVDAIGYYMFGQSINNIIFNGYAIRNGVHYGMISIIKNGGIRSSGFNYDPAHIGFVSPIIAAYGLKKKNLILVFLSFVAAFSALSVTAVVSCSIIVFAFGAKSVFKSKKRKGHVNLLGFVVGLFAVCILIYIFKDYLSIAYDNFFNRINDTYLDSSDNIRLDYIKFLPQAMFQAGPLMIFGTGFGTASYPYSHHPDISAHFGETWFFPYDMENTYIAYIFDCGIIGFAIFLYFIFNLIRSYSKCYRFNNDYTIIYCFTIASLISMLFYHYILFAPQMLLLTIASVEMDKKRVEIYE